VTRAVAIIVALGACVVPAGSGFAPRTVAPTAVPSPSSSPSSPPVQAEPARDVSGAPHSGPILRDQIDQLEGLPVEDAKAKLAACFVGKLYVVEGTYLASCKTGTVCQIQPGSGFSTHAEVIFTVNPKLEISAP
jgi:hypothetical protein